MLPHLALRNDYCGGKPEFMGSVRVDRISRVKNRVSSVLRIRFTVSISSGSGDDWLTTILVLRNDYCSIIYCRKKACYVTMKVQWL